MTFKDISWPDDASDEESQKCKDLIYLISGETVDESMKFDIMPYISCYYGEIGSGEYYTGGTFITWKHFDENMNDTVIYKIIDPDDDLSGISYKVSGEEYPVEDAVKYCENYINENLMQYFNEGEELKLTDIIVTQNEIFNEYEYVLHYTHLIDGVAVDDCGFTDDEFEYMRESFFELTLSAKNEIQFFNNRCYYQTEEVENVKKIIPLSEAEQILSDTLAPNASYTVSECELKYCCLVDPSENNEYLNYEPMWSFTLDNYEGENYGPQYLKYKTAYVNALTGEVIYYDMNSCTLERYEYQE